MRAYIIRRLLLMVPTLLFVTLIVFFLVRFVPGSVIDIMIAEMAAEEEMSDEQMEALADDLRAQLGMDVAVHIQYGRWLGFLPHPNTGFNGVIQGNLGYSLWGDWSVFEELKHRLPISIELGMLSLAISIIIAIPIGVFSAVRQDTAGDYTGRSIAIAFISIPSFWSGTMITVYPSIWWEWSPPITYIPLTESVAGNLAQFLVPALIMGMLFAGTQMRMMRTMMLEVLRQDYIRTAWAKGLSERVIISRHAMKNALIPVVTLAGNMIPTLVGGLVVIETIFNLPGMGRLLVTALSQRDYPVVSGINLTVAGAILVINLLIDLSYAYLDPRVVYK